MVNFAHTFSLTVYYFKGIGKAIYKKVRSGYVAWIEEIPGVNTQGASKKEVRENLSDALSEFLLARRDFTKRERSRGASFVRERFVAV